MADTQPLRFGRYVFDPEQHVLLHEGRIVPAPPKVLETLELLLAARGRVVSKQEFMLALWPDSFVEESNLTQNIFVLRRLLGAMDTGQAYVETVPKRGYRLVATVEPVVEHVLAEQGMAEQGMAEQGVTEAAALGTAEQVPAVAELPAERVAPVLIALAEARNKGVGGRVWLAAALVLVGLAWWGVTGRQAVRVTVTDTRRLTGDGVPKALQSFPTMLVSDGRRIYFPEQQDNQTIMAAVPLEGGEVLKQAPPFPDAQVVDYSAANQALLWGSVWHTADDRPLLRQAQDGTGQRQIGELTGHDASWSPDGHRLAFTHGRFLNVADADGSNQRTLVSAEGVVFWPRWSPDGRRLRYSVNFASNKDQMWEVGADGSKPHEVDTGGANHDMVCCGGWTADGRWFFFLEDGPSTNRMWVMPGTTSRWPLSSARAQRLTLGPGDHWYGPLPSQDGSKLWLIGAHRRGELVRVDPQTRECKPYLGGLSAEGVSFSPNGKWVVYTAYPEGTLWKSRPDGTERMQLTRPPTVARFPRWSPDGHTIAFLGGDPGKEWRLYLVSADKGGMRPLFRDDVNQGVPSWSPDGQTIAFGRLIDYGTERNPNLTVELYDLRKGSETTLHGSQGLWTPRWSPDGRFFTAVTQDSQILRLFDMRTQQWSDLADVGVNDVVWTPDSQYVFFDTVFGANPMLYRVRIADRKVEPWADLRGLHRGGFFGPWLGITPDGAPLLLRDTAIEELYEFQLAFSR